jgi:hypothetical protein
MGRPYVDKSLSACCIETAARWLIRARNHHGLLRSVIRAEIHADIALLRQWRRASSAANSDGRSS